MKERGREHDALSFSVPPKFPSLFEPSHSAQIIAAELLLLLLPLRLRFSELSRASYL